MGVFENEVNRTIKRLQRLSKKNVQYIYPPPETITSMR